MSLATPQSDRELITLAVPVLNEEAYIAELRKKAHIIEN